MPPPETAPQKVAIPGVKSVIAVASGKGGVGKSTVATNLALALQMLGRRVGLLDADIYGPSIPIMMGIHEVFDPNATQFPLERYGLKLMSMGFWVKPETAMIWRGPMVHKYLTVFLTQIPWGELDYLVIDLPPGTGDAQLTLTQTPPKRPTPRSCRRCNCDPVLFLYRRLHASHFHDCVCHRRNSPACERGRRKEERQERIPACPARPRTQGSRKLGRRLGRKRQI